MSKYLTNNAVQEFDAEVKHQYQSIGSSLRNTVTMRSGVVGDQYKFARMGRGMAGQKASAADVTPMDVSHARQVAYLYNWYAAEYTDIFDQQEVNYAEKSELAKVIAYAIKRREDQIILDTLAGITYGATGVRPVSADYGYHYDYSATGKFVQAVVHAIVEHYQYLEIMGNDEIHIAVQSSMLQTLLAESNGPVATIDSNAIKALMSGTISDWMGMKWHVIGGAREEGGIAATDDTDLYGFAWAKSAVGLAVGIDMKTEINYIPQKTAWLVNGLYKAGCVAREPQGIVRFRVAP